MILLILVSNDEKNLKTQTTVENCQIDCSNKCEFDFQNNINNINDCKVKECKCDVLSIISSEKRYSRLVSYFIDILIVLSLISLTISIIVIFLFFYKRHPNGPEGRVDYNVLSELNDINDLSEITPDKDDKSFEDSDYEIMTTHPNSREKENNIRDF